MKSPSMRVIWLIWLTLVSYLTVMLAAWTDHRIRCGYPEPYDEPCHTFAWFLARHWRFVWSLLTHLW